MTTYLIAGGGTAGHVNPMLAIADEIVARHPESTIIMLGTKEGLESRLIPERGYELVTIPKLPFPRRPDARALRFLKGYRPAVASIVSLLRDRHVDVVVGVGGYVSAPAYAAARKAGVPYVIHEANAIPGLANRLGAKRAAAVAVAFSGTPLRGAQVVGMPLRQEISTLNIAKARKNARASFGLRADLPTLVVTGGSQGARSINNAIIGAAPALTETGIQIVHITGAGFDGPEITLAGYHRLEYCDRMHDALAAADLVVSRAGSSTVSELTALGIPAIYVPYPVGNGEQVKNARPTIDAGGGVLVLDADFTADWARKNIPPLMSDPAQLATMAAAAASVGHRDASSLMVNLIDAAVATGQRSAS